MVKQQYLVLSPVFFIIPLCVPRVGLVYISIVQHFTGQVKV